MQARDVLLVGCGNMGRALVQGWLRGGLPPASIRVVEPAALAREKLGATLRCVAASKELTVDRFDAVVFAVKPQELARVAAEYRRFKHPDTLYISIAAGRTLASLAAQLGEDAALVRAMPNTPAAIGQGITVLCANAHAHAQHRDLAAQLLASVGQVAWIEDEALMDAVTAVSGSGPAYVFLVLESLAAAGVAAGLPDGLAMQLARATLAGAAQLAAAADTPPAELRRQVTSPGGTTEAGLAVLMDKDQLKELFERAVAAAQTRSRELR